MAASPVKVREFRALFAGQTLSTLGDQIGRVALAALVFQRTHSAAYSALSLAVTYLPYLVGGSVLAAAADRYPRRTVMITCDVVRACIVASMALGLPTSLLVALLFLDTLISCPFEAARSATLPHVLPDAGQYERGVGWTVLNLQLAGMTGWFVGGLTLGWLSPSIALLLDSATYLASAAVVSAAVHRRPAVNADTPSSWWHDVRQGGAVVFGDPTLRLILTVAVVGSAVVAVPEGLAVAYAGTFGSASWVIGALLGVSALGLALGVFLTRFLPSGEDITQMMLAIGVSTLPMLAFFTRPGLLLALVLLLVAGILQGAAVVKSNVAFVRRVDDRNRGRAMGLAGVAIMGGQGILLMTGGIIAEHLAIHVVFGFTGFVVLAATTGFHVARRATAPVAVPRRDMLPANA